MPKTRYRSVMRGTLYGSRSARLGADELDDDAGELLAAVLLQEVAAADDRGVARPLRAGDALLEDPGTPLGDGIAVAERREPRLRPARQHLPRLPVRHG